MTIAADSAGATPIQSQLNLTDGVFLVSTTADSGPGSLRQAILDSNAASGGANTIEFAIAGLGAQTIMTGSSLPPITNPVVVDGSSQPGYAGTPLIVLDGRNAGTAAGLTISTSGSTIRGLDIVDFLFGGGILVAGPNASGNQIVTNVIGMDPSGTFPLANGTGVQISGGAHDNVVGGMGLRSAT